MDAKAILRQTEQANPDLYELMLEQAKETVTRIEAEMGDTLPPTWTDMSEQEKARWVVEQQIEQTLNQLPAGIITIDMSAMGAMLGVEGLDEVKDELADALNQMLGEGARIVKIR